MTMPSRRAAAVKSMAAAVCSAWHWVHNAVTYRGAQHVRRGAKSPHPPSTNVGDGASRADLRHLPWIITTFAVVAGVAGGGLSLRVVLIFAAANLVADGLSMAVGNYLQSLA
jgi:hypothetical protein